MKTLGLLLSILIIAGCAARIDVPMVENSSAAPDRVNAVNMRVGIVLPDENMVKSKVTGSVTETIPAGKHLRNMEKKLFPKCLFICRGCFRRKFS